MIINRKKYLDSLIRKMNNGLVKVITGIRRSGKSFLLFNLFKNYLLSNNVDLSHIIEISFDKESNKKLLNHKKFLTYINEQILDDKKYFVFIDEIQYMKKFEPVIIELISNPKLDVYVTGSNSKFLSNDINTALRGKNDTIHVFPLSFSELMQAYTDKYDAWRDYINYGSLPYLIHLEHSEDKRNYLKSIFTEVYIKDLLERNKIRHKYQFEELVKVVASTSGSLINAINISNTFLSVEKEKIATNTVLKYLSYMENAFLINKVERYDLNGRRYIGASKKYYFEDIGLKKTFLDFKEENISFNLENIVYNELKYRGYDVCVGIVPFWEKNINGNSVQKWAEIDFVVKNGNKTTYIQVAESLSNEIVKKRELKSFSKIANGCKRIVLTTDIIVPYVNNDEVLAMNIIDFLLDDKSLDR